MKLLTLLIFMCSSILLKAQSFSMAIKRPAMQEIKSIEAAAGGEFYPLNSSIRFSVSKGYFPGSDQFTLGNPLIYFRAVPFRVEVNYYYSISDSVVRLAEYTLNNNDTALLKKVFDNNAEQIGKTFGRPVSDTTEDHGDWQQRTVVWQDTETYIKQFSVTSRSTNRLRVLVSWKQ